MLNKIKDTYIIHIDISVINFSLIFELNKYSNLDLKFGEVFSDMLDTIVIEQCSIRKNGNRMEVFLLISVTKDISSKNIVLMKTKYPCKTTYQVLDIFKGEEPYLPVSDSTIWLAKYGLITLYGSLKQGKYYVQGSYFI